MSKWWRIGIDATNSPVGTGGRLWEWLKLEPQGAWVNSQKNRLMGKFPSGHPDLRVFTYVTFRDKRDATMFKLFHSDLPLMTSTRCGTNDFAGHRILYRSK